MKQFNKKENNVAEHKAVKPATARLHRLVKVRKRKITNTKK